jgi:small subunit ribosomal protein S20
MDSTAKIETSAEVLDVDNRRALARFTALLRNKKPFMPNTKSAERRMRNSARKQLHNRSITSNLRRVEKEFRAVIAAGKKDEAAKLLPGVHSAYDKAVKVGVVKRPTANRKKSRLALALATKQ